MRHVVVTAVLVALSGPALAMSDTDCSAMWTQADANADGALSGPEAERYAAWMRSSGKTMAEGGAIARTDFDENCKADVFTTAAADAGAPLAGANSFTEGQARDRAVAAGYASVSAMTKDENGIWRGTAMKDGKSTPVAVDYKGNVVAG